MYKINVAFDLDGTLIWLMPVVERLLWQKYRVRVPEIRNFMIETEPEISFDVLMDTFCEAFHCIDEIEIFPGATELLRSLWEITDDPVRIITARPYSAATDTYNLVSKICPDFPFELILVEDSNDKILHLRNYKYFVDDRRKTAKDLSDKGIFVFMPKRSYNQPYEPNMHIKVIEDIQELIPRIPKLIYKE